jgi:hypothetical protein
MSNIITIRFEGLIKSSNLITPNDGLLYAEPTYEAVIEPLDGLFINQIKEQLNDFMRSEEDTYFGSPYDDIINHYDVLLSTIRGPKLCDEFGDAKSDDELIGKKAKFVCKFVLLSSGEVKLAPYIVESLTISTDEVRAEDVVFCGNDPGTW